MVLVKGNIFQIINHFFPFKVSAARKWEISDSEIARSLKADADDRFIAKWLAGQNLDSDCEELLELGREIYKTFFKEFKNLPTAKYKVEHWDAGWWQIKRSLVEGGFETERLEQIEEIKKRIGAKICEQALELGIITSA
jgi:hypothetical protein